MNFICPVCALAPGDAKTRAKGFFETILAAKKSKANTSKKDKNKNTSSESFTYHNKCYMYKNKWKGVGEKCEVTGRIIIRVHKLDKDFTIVQTWDEPNPTSVKTSTNTPTASKPTSKTKENKTKETVELNDKIKSNSPKKEEPQKQTKLPPEINNHNNTTKNSNSATESNAVSNKNKQINQSIDQKNVDPVKVVLVVWKEILLFVIFTLFFPKLAEFQDRTFGLTGLL